MAGLHLFQSHGPYWHVPTRRLDGRISRADGTKDLPPPNSDIAELKAAAFAEKNLTTKDSSSCQVHLPASSLHVYFPNIILLILMLFFFIIS
jgi:hypothetical protein